MDFGKVCKPAHPGYYGTLGNFDESGIWKKYTGNYAGGGIVDNSSKPDRHVDSDSIQRKYQFIDELDCPPDKSLNWSPNELLVRKGTCDLGPDAGTHYIDHNKLPTSKNHHPPYQFDTKNDNVRMLPHHNFGVASEDYCDGDDGEVSQKCAIAVLPPGKKPSSVTGESGEYDSQWHSAVAGQSKDEYTATIWRDNTNDEESTGLVDLWSTTYNNLCLGPDGTTPWYYIKGTDVKKVLYYPAAEIGSETAKVVSALTQTGSTLGWTKSDNCSEGGDRNADFDCGKLKMGCKWKEPPTVPAAPATG